MNEIFQKVSEFVFTKLIFDTHPLPSILCLAIAGANFILPTQWLNEKLFRYQVEPETKSYYDAEDDFDTVDLFFIIEVFNFFRIT